MIEGVDAPRSLAAAQNANGRDQPYETPRRMLQFDSELQLRSRTRSLRNSTNAAARATQIRIISATGRVSVLGKHELVLQTHSSRLDKNPASVTEANDMDSSH